MSEQAVISPEYLLSRQGVPKEISLQLARVNEISRVNRDLLISSNIAFHATPGERAILLGAETFGTENSENLSGGPGLENISGLDGDDTILGGFGADTLRGDAGNDRLEGGSGNDRLFGGDGDDILEGGADFDRLTVHRSIRSHSRGDQHEAIVSRNR